MRITKLPALVAVAACCIACGAKQDYSGDNELAKSQASNGQAATTGATKGASAHAAMMVPQQRHP